MDDGSKGRSLGRKAERAMLRGIGIYQRCRRNLRKNNFTCFFGGEREGFSPNKAANPTSPNGKEGRGRMKRSRKEFVGKPRTTKLAHTEEEEEGTHTFNLAPPGKVYL